MNDYLWDKTGSDAEIEGLENMLAALAHCPDRKPAVRRPEPAAAEGTNRFGIFKLSLGFAFAGLVIAAAASFVILPYPTKRSAAAIELPMPRSNKIVSPLSADGPATAPQVERASFVPRPKSKSRKPRRVVRSTPPRKERPQVLTLTAEEVDAYRQLMTALAITSTQLKIVKDTINGTED